MIDGEWPQCDAVLQRWLAAENFDEHGRQRRSMADFVTKSLHTE
ncbi:Acetyltransferase, GNAT family [Citrobacter freundii]|nr:Acetyltransferase, GNAT family [Citrobacter freundii]